MFILTIHSIKHSLDFSLESSLLLLVLIPLLLLILLIKIISCFKNRGKKCDLISNFLTKFQGEAGVWMKHTESQPESIHESVRIHTCPRA